MKINIVTEKAPGWVLRWIAESYAKYIPGCVVNTEVDKTADINFYINYDIFQQKSGTIDVGYFTHKERVYEDKAYEGLSDKEKEFMRNNAFVRGKHFEEVANEVDWCIAMNERLLDDLPREKSTVNLIPPDPQFMKGDIVIGWVGRTSKTGRKRINWMEDLHSIEGIKIKATEGKYDWKELPEFYKSIDYLLIYSENEGGPLPLVEALAMGVPVISNNVGFVPKYTTLRFNTLEELKQLLSGLVIKKDAWEKSSKDLYNVFLNLYNSRK